MYNDIRIIKTIESVNVRVHYFSTHAYYLIYNLLQCVICYVLPNISFNNTIGIRKETLIFCICQCFVVSVSYGLKI